MKIKQKIIKTELNVPKKRINATNAIGIISRHGRYNSGTFVHPDIAFEFASWLSPEF